MLLLKCLSLLTLVALLDAARFQCDYTFYKDAGGYLKFQEMPLTFDDAKQRCASEGSILASPINDGIKAAMMGSMKNRQVNTAAFTGISKKSNSNGIFSSVERIQLSDIPHTWAPGEPDNCNNKESCIAMFPDGTMADVKCTEPLPHFCFLKEAKAQKLNACGPKNKDYTLERTTGSCYKLHLTKLDYDAAARICEEEGGYLIIINGVTEAEAVSNLFSTIPMSVGGQLALSGFRINNVTGEWMTLQGETIAEAGYEKWAPGEPNNKYEYCGSIIRSNDVFMLNDMLCFWKHVFICEKDPEILLCN